MNWEFYPKKAESSDTDEQLMFNELGMYQNDSREYQDGWVSIYSPTVYASRQEWIFVVRRTTHDDAYFTLPIMQMSENGPSEDDRENLHRWLDQLFAIYQFDTTDN